MRKTISIFILLGGLVVLKTSAQQSPLYTQYMFNKLLYNPAVAGIDPYYQIRSDHRFQWVGIQDPPMTNALSIYGPHTTMDMGYGGYLYHDRTGPTSRTGITGTYAYNISITDDIRLSMGVSLGIIQYKVDGTQIDIKDLTDQALQKAVYSSYAPDANFGLYLYTENYYVGFSTSQLINTKLKLYDQSTGLNKLKSHFFLTGGYLYEINSDFKVEPSIMIKETAPLIIQMDFNARVIYQDRGWLGLSVRTKDALSVLLGYIHENRIYIGYSYDFTLTDLRKYNSGTHEIMIGYRFNDIKR